MLDTDPDNFGSYAGDGLNDHWQYEFFGPDNPLAGPAIDADADGDVNRFEFVAGVDPTDPQSCFRLSLHPVPERPGHRELVFTPRLAIAITRSRYRPISCSRGCPSDPPAKATSASQSDCTGPSDPRPSTLNQINIMNHRHLITALSMLFLGILPGGPKSRNSSNFRAASRSMASTSTERARSKSPSSIQGTIDVPNGSVFSKPGGWAKWRSTAVLE